MEKVVVPPPPPNPRPTGPKTIEPARPEPGAPSVSIGGNAGESGQVKAAYLAEALVQGALPAAMPLAIDAILQARQKSKTRAAYRNYLLQQLQAPPKFGSVLTPVKRQMGSFAEGLMQTTADELNQATNVPLESSLPFTKVPPARTIL